MEALRFGLGCAVKHLVVLTSYLNMTSVSTLVNVVVVATMDRRPLP